MDALAQLVAYFSDELDHRIDSDDPRTQLDELLRIRPAAPIPVEIVSLLHTLLTQESAGRHVVDVTDLPALQTEYAGLGPLGAVRLWQGDITTCRADAIVNPASPGMLGCFIPWHQCIDHAIHREAGPGLRAECATIMRSGRTAEPGSVKTTAGYHLPCRHVIHALGPQFEAPAARAQDLKTLATCYRRSLEAAALVTDHSLVLPPIGTMSGLSAHESADVALDVLSRWLRRHAEMFVVLNTCDDTANAAYREAVARRATTSY